jgi:hypothetical protein
MTLAPTCFGLYKNHRQGAVQYLVKTTDKNLMYISLDVVNVWHHVILRACLRCVWITMQAGTLILIFSFNQVLDSSLSMVHV